MRPLLLLLLLLLPLLLLLVLLTEEPTAPTPADACLESTPPGPWGDPD